jgi:hypothetical protein
MTIDKYTKVVLTGILIFLGVIAFDYKPIINAQATTSVSRGMISTVIEEGGVGLVTRVWQLNDRRIRQCYAAGRQTYGCYPWLPK